jgi:2-keto-3-deoxy-L-rhamnonate aldolase RhmA
MADLRGRIRAGETVYGTFLGVGSAAAAEACALAGFDWLLTDLEHGSGNEQSMAHEIAAAEVHDVPVLVRVESDARIRTGRVLDAGAAGVMFPRLDDPAQVAAAIRHLWYPPMGDRGIATYTRSCDYGLNPGALDTANDRVVGVVQIESLSALEHVDDIAAIDGVDVIFVGPRDLSHALGVPGQTEAPEFRDALRRVVTAAAASDVAAGILAGAATQAADYVSMGFRFVGIGSDISLLAQAAVAARRSLP